MPSNLSILRLVSIRGAESWWGCSDSGFDSDFGLLIDSGFGSDFGLLIDSDSGSDSDSDSDSDFDSGFDAKYEITL